MCPYQLEHQKYSYTHRLLDSVQIKCVTPALLLMDKSTALLAVKVYTHRTDNVQENVPQDLSLTLIQISVSLAPQHVQAVTIYTQQIAYHARILVFF